jgi:cation diffusion facilitator family transporter
MSGHGNGGTKAILAALGANLGIAIAKFIGFLITGASSMLAESVHSLADTTNQALLLVGNRQAKRDQDERHPFGYGASRYFWSFVVALVLFSLGGVFAVYEGLHKIQHPEELDRPAVAIFILLVAVGLEGFSFWTAITESLPLKGDQSWFSFIKTSRVPELPVLLLEDFGALMGLMIALGAVVMSLVTDNPVWDGYGTLAIGVLLLVIAAVLIVEMRGLLLGESATREDVDTITNTIEASPDVTRLIHMRTVHQGPEDVLVAAKIEFRSDMALSAVAESIDNIEARIRACVPVATMIYLEPAVFNPNHPGPSRLSAADSTGEQTTGTLSG